MKSRRLMQFEVGVGRAHAESKLDEISGVESNVFEADVTSYKMASAVS